MADFPKLRTGAVAQYPSSFAIRSTTRTLTFIDGKEQRWPEAGELQRSWTLNLSKVSQEELSAIEDFFVAQQGEFGQFTFTDPYDGTIYPNCSFDGDSIRGVLVDEDNAQSTLVIRTNL